MGQPEIREYWTAEHDDTGGVLTKKALIFGFDGVSKRRVATDSDGHLQVDILSGGGAGTEFNEDTAHTTGDKGTQVLGVRNDAGGTLSDTDGDYTPIQFDSSGRLRVVTQGGAGGTSSVDDSSFSVGVDSGTPMMALFDDTSPDSVDENDVGVPRMSGNRNLYNTIRDSAGNERGMNVNASNQASVSVDNSPTLGANSGVDIGDVDVTSFAHGKTVKHAVIDVSSSGDNTIVAAVGGKKIKVFSFSIQATGTVNTKFKDGASTDLTGAYNWQAREGLSTAVSVPSFLFATAAGNAFILNLSGAVQVVGHVSYWDDDAT